MKTNSSTPNPDAEPTPTQGAAQPPAQPTYNSGLHYNTPGLHYALTDPPALPVDDGAKVRLDLQSRSDDDLPPFSQAISTAMAAQPLFAGMTPTALVFDAAVADFAAKLQAQRLAKAAALQATQDKNTSRLALESLLNLRGSYVQTASKGNASVILSAAMPLRRAPTPMGVLPPPLGLRVDLNGTVGKMILNWDAVVGARTYLLERAVVVNGVTGPWEMIEVGGRPTLTLNGMTVGVEYAFRVAAAGGTGGRSDWSTVVMRTAA